MSARAAWRLEGLGFTQVYRYTAGKADWAANLLPTEGGGLTGNRAGDLARRDVARCRVDERISDVRARLQRQPDDSCAVLNEQNILLGRLAPSALQSPDDTPVGDLMSPGPVTMRPNETAERLMKFFERTDTKSVWVTTSEGELVGLLAREDVERRMRT